MDRRWDVMSIAAGGAIVVASWFPLFTYREITPELAGACSAWTPCLGDVFGGALDASRALPWLVVFAASIAVGVPLLRLAIKSDGRLGRLWLAGTLLALVGLGLAIASAMDRDRMTGYHESNVGFWLEPTWAAAVVLAGAVSAVIAAVAHRP